MIFVQKILKSITTTKLNTRKNLHKKFNRTSVGVSSTRNKVISIWITTPGKIKQSISINIFNKKIKQFLISE